MAEWQQLAFKRIGDDVSGDFAFNETIADFSDSFATYADLADAQEFWPNSGSDVIVNVSTNVIDMDSDTITFDTVDYDLWRFGIFPSDTNWTMRFKWTLSDFVTNTDNTGQYLGFVLSDSDRNTAPSSSQHFIGFKLTSAGSVSTYQVVEGFNDGPTNGSANDGNFDHAPAVEILYIEVKRTDGTHAEMSMFQDADFKTLIEKVRFSPTVAVDALRFIKFFAQNSDGSANGTEIATVTQVQFFNNTEGVQDFIALTGEKTTPDFADDFSSYTTAHSQTAFFEFFDATGWTEEDSTRARIDTLLGLFTISNVERNGTNDSLIFDLGLAIQPPTTFEDNFNSSANWTQFGTDVFIDTGAGVLQADNFNPTGGTNGVSHDLGSTSLAWILRFKWDVTNASTPSPNTAIYVGLSSINAGNILLAPQDGINVALDYSSGGSRRFVSHWSDNEAYLANGDLVQSNIGTADPQIWYVQLTRIANTSFRVDIYDDPNFSNLIKTETNGTLGLTGLRYIRINTNESSGTGGTETQIDNIQFWDGINNLNIGSLDDSNWCINYKLSILNNVFSSNELTSAIGAYDSDGSFGALDIQDSFFLDIGNDGGGGRFKIRRGDGLPLFSATSATFTTPADPGVYYVQQARIGSAFRIGLYSDAQFLELIEEQTLTSPANSGENINSLRYIGYKNPEDSLAVGTCGFRIDDMAVVNRFSVKKEPIEETESFVDNFVYADQATADTAWPFNQADQKVDQPNENLKWKIIRDGTNNAVAHDLGSPVSDTKWTLRFKWLPTGNTLASSLSAGTSIGIFDNDETNGFSASNDAIAVNFGDNSATPQTFSLFGINGGVLLTTGSLGSNNWDFNIPTYVELRRENSVRAKLRLFRDPDYQILQSENNLSINAGTIGLQYIKILSNDVAGGGYNGDVEGIIDNMQLWDDSRAQESEEAWVESEENIDARISLDLQEQKIDYDMILDATNRQIAFDLGSPLSDTAWVLRWTHTVDFMITGSSAGKYNWFGISSEDQDVASNQVQDRIFLFQLTNIGNFNGNYRLSIGNDVIVDNAGEGDTFVTTPVDLGLGEFVYFEMVRVDADNARLSIFRDADYTDLVETVQVTGSQMSSSLTGLRYIKYMMRDLVNSAGEMRGTIRNIEVWDGVNVVDGFETKDSLQLQGFIKQTDGAIRPIGQFNADDRAIYNIRNNFGFTGGDALVTFTSYLVQGSSTSDDRFFYLQITNRILEAITVEHRMVNRGTLGSGTAPNVSEGVGDWENEVERITRMFWLQDMAGSYDTDTSLVLFGSD